MNPQAIHALLRDSSGSVLVVRRRGAVLLGLPGGDMRGSASLGELLSTYCARQVGVTPDFVEQPQQFTLAEKRIAILVAEIPHARAGARGRVEAVFWIKPENLPETLDPIARYAIALGMQGSLRTIPTALGLANPHELLSRIVR